MLKIRLQRIGRRHDPQFRVVVTEHTNAPKSGKFLEIVGTYNAKSGDISLKAERVQHWLSEGAQASDTVHNILIDHKILSGKKINVLPKKSPITKESEGSEVSAVATSEASVPETPPEASEIETKKEGVSADTSTKKTPEEPKSAPQEPDEESQPQETSEEVVAERAGETPVA